MGSVKLTWTNPADTDLKGVKVYRKIGAGADTELASLLQDPATPGGSVDINDTAATTGSVNQYTVRPYDVTGNQESGTATSGNQKSITPVASLTDVYDKWSALSANERLDSLNGLSNIYGYADTNIVIALDTAEKRAGTACLKATSAAVNNKVAFTFNHAAMEVGGIYTLKLWVKSTLPSSALDQILTWVGFCNIPANVTLSPISSTWTEYTFTGLVYSNYSHAYRKPFFQFNIGEAAKNIFIDSVTMIKTGQLAEETGTNLLDANCCSVRGSSATVVSSTNWAAIGANITLSANNADITGLSGQGHYLKIAKVAGAYSEGASLKFTVASGSYYKVELDIYTTQGVAATQFYPATNLELCFKGGYYLSPSQLNAWQTQKVVVVVKAIGTGTALFNFFPSQETGDANIYIDDCRVTKLV